MADRERSIRVEAVVIRHSNWGEADRLLVLFTRERGKVRAIAKGVRKMHSRKAGHLEPFTRVSLQLARGRDLWIVTQAETVEPYLQIREDLVRTAYASYVVELVERFTYEEGSSIPLYQLLQETLKRIATEEDCFLAVRFYRDPYAGPGWIPPPTQQLRQVRSGDQGGGSILRCRDGRGALPGVRD